MARFWNRGVHHPVDRPAATPAEDRSQAAPGPPDGGRRPLRTWPAFPPLGYLGQLTDEHQRSLAADRAGLTLEDCSFYHTAELRDGTVVPGPWDLRGREAEYLGGVDLAGARVLEIGPASGSVTFWMEDQGADVVGFDAGYDVSVDIQPPLGFDDRRLKRDHLEVVDACQNAWWYLHRDRRSRARVAYGNVYDLPGDLGQFDVSVVTAVLLHCRSPITVLEQAARRTRDTIIVAEPVPDDAHPVDANVMSIFPLGEEGRWVIWWSIYAGAVVAMLRCLGFGDVTITRHTQLHQHRHDATTAHQELPMYTVVGRRSH
jgi:hypothetical protein